MRKFGLLAVVLLCSCASMVQPPKRPVAYMYPSVRPLSSLDGLTAVTVTTAQIRNLLKENAVERMLNEAGLQESELELVVRGLAKHGYAEIDARKTECPVQVVCFSHGPQGIRVDIISR